MKVKITIEEVVSQDFVVEVSSEESAYEEIREMYKNGSIIVEDPSLTQANVMIYDGDEETDWVDLHV